MAPQAKPQANPDGTIKLTPEQIQAENFEARSGSDDGDGLIERGATEDVNQNHGRDPLEGGVERREPIQRSPQDDARSRIAARFRRTEEGGDRPFNGDFSDPENVVGRMAETDEDDSDDDLADLGLSAEEIARARGQRAAANELDEDDDADPAPRQPARQQQDQPQGKHRIKVNGRVIELTTEQLIERASKVEAADTYLQETRDLLKEAKAVRSGRTVRHDGENGAETDDLGTDPVELEVQNHEPSTRSVIEKIQFGDPDEAAAELERLVDQRAGKKATEGQLDRVIKQDLARSQKQLKEFSDANPQLGNNRIAALAIEDGMYRGYREDMLTLGLAEEQIPQDATTLARWHRFYRVNGHDVRSTKDLLEGSKKEFLASIGQLTGGRRQNPAPSRQQPRIQVNVDRDQRRMAIPSQPTRSVAPRRDVQPQNRPQTGSDVVNAMRRQRGQPVI